jgi:hypothetical protein
MPSELWGSQTNAPGGTRTRAGFTGGQQGYRPPEAWEGPDLQRRRNQRQQRPVAQSAVPPQNTGVNTQPLGQLLSIADQLSGMRQDFYGQRIGSNPRFDMMVPAREIQLGQPLSARGWDQYAALAGAGASPEAQEAAGEWALMNAPRGINTASRGA